MALQEVGTKRRRCLACGLVSDQIKYAEEGGGGEEPLYACQECGNLAYRPPAKLAAVSTTRDGLLAGLGRIKEVMACE